MRPIAIVAALAALLGSGADALRLSALNQRLDHVAGLAAAPPAKRASPEEDRVALLAVEGLRAEIAKLHLELARLKGSAIATEEKLKAEVVAHLGERDREDFVRKLKRSAEVIEAQTRVLQIDMKISLRLTDDQIPLIQQIFRGFVDLYRAAVIAASLDRPVEQDMEVLFLDVEGKVRAVLTEEQRKRWTGCPRGWMTARPRSKSE